jgi:hypothetical protein
MFLLGRVDFNLGGSVRVEVGHIVGDPGVLETHVLGHRPFSAIALLAVGDRTHELALDLVGAAPHSLFLVIS